MAENNRKQRFNSAYDYLRFKGNVRTQKHLAEIMGTTAPNVSSALKGVGSVLTDNFLERFNNSFNRVFNTEWLINGQGEMLNKEFDNNNVIIEVQKVPLLPLDAIGGSLNEFVSSVKKHECEQVVSPIDGADFAITVSGDSMSPEYPNGSRIFIKKINERAFIDWGKTYVLDTCNGVVVKQLVPSDVDPKKYVKCLSINENPKYAPFEVSWEDIYGVYRVLLCMSIK